MPKNKLKVTIASVGKSLFDDEARSIILPSAEGQMQVLANHEPFISTLRNGTIIIRDKDGKDQEFTIGGGVLEVSNNHATVLVS